MGGESFGVVCLMRIQSTREFWSLSIVSINLLFCFARVEGAATMDVLFNALSASRIRRSRACCNVDRDSLIRDTASLSGWMLKFPTVWWMSC